MINRILAHFKRLFPDYHSKIKKYRWFASDRHTIVMILDDQREYMFTYDDEMHWSFEPFSNRARKLQ